jgi:hypothetical protein
VTTLAIRRAIRLLSQSRSRCHCPDSGPDPACGDAPRQHQADGRCLTSSAGVQSAGDGAKLGSALYLPGEVT